MSRGIFRLWIVCAAAWVGFAAFRFLSTCSTDSAGVRWCQLGTGDWQKELSQFALSDYAEIVGFAAVPPILFGLAILTIGWVFNGFRQKSNA